MSKQKVYDQQSEASSLQNYLDQGVVIGKTILLNADDESESSENGVFVFGNNTKERLSISFECIKNLVGAASTKRVAERLRNGTLRLIDNTSDQYKKVVNCPGPGWSNISEDDPEWHRPCSTEG